MKRSSFFQLNNGSKASLPFSDKEYENRLLGLREIISKKNLDAVILTSMQNIAYYSGFLYCSFGRPYALVVTLKRNIVISANIDASQPWRRSYGENLIYTSLLAIAKTINKLLSIIRNFDGNKFIKYKYSEIQKNQINNLNKFYEHIQKKKKI